jgi:hypothetical protein
MATTTKDNNKGCEEVVEKLGSPYTSGVIVK